MLWAEGKTNPKALRTCLMPLRTGKRPMWLEWTEQHGAWEEVRLERWGREISDHGPMPF